MDLTLPITYNGLTVNGSLAPSGGGAAMSGYVVEEADITPVDVTQRMDKRALQDGMDAQDVYLGGRRVSMIVTAYGSTRGDFWDKAQDLLAAFSPTVAYNADTANAGFLALDFTQPTADIATWPTSAYPSGIPLRLYCRPTAVPAYSMRRDDQGGAAAAGLAKPFRVSLIARDPRKYTQAQQSVTIGTSNVTATNNGDYPTYPTLTLIAGATTGSTSVTIGANTLTVWIDTASATYVLDTAAQTLKRNGVLHMELLATGNVYQPLSAGATVCVRTALTGLTATLAYRDAFA